MPSEKPDFLKIILPFTMSVMCIISYSVFNEHWFFSLSQNMLARICLHIRLSGFTVTQTLACIPVKPTKMGSSGLEPPTSRLSGARSSLLSYEPVSFPVVLPVSCPSLFGGDDGIRTHDPLLAGQVLSQLSYTPVFRPPSQQIP